jgi:hypothetical protein
MEQGFDQAGGFGAALAIADFDGDGYDALAAGAPGERGAVDPMSKTAAGGVNVIYGSADGLTVAGNQLWRQSTEGVPGAEEAWDSFGTAVAAGQFNADAFADRTRTACPRGTQRHGRGRRRASRARSRTITSDSPSAGNRVLTARGTTLPRAAFV